MYIISRVRHCEGGKEKVTVEGNSGNGPLALTGHRGKREGGPGGREEGGREGRSTVAKQRASKKPSKLSCCFLTTEFLIFQICSKIKILLSLRKIMIMPRNMTGQHA